MRKFGVEIEVAGINCIKAQEAVRSVGIACVMPSHDHRTIQTWKVVPDGSIEPYGSEVVSPILEDEDGLSQLAIIGAALRAAGGTVNKSCGLHVHVDARKLTFKQIMNVARRYHKFESEIDALMPKSRRGNRNNFCNSLSNLFQSRYGVDIPKYKKDLGDLERYLKVNISAYAVYGTIEFRQHGGTLDGVKMQNWVRFCTQFVDASCDLTCAEDSLFRGVQDEVKEFYMRRAQSFHPPMDVLQAQGL